MEVDVNNFNRVFHAISCQPKNISLADTTIRYIVVSNGNFVNLLSNIDELNGIPLFLAKDVFSICDLTQSNVQRIHARYSKEGLATKVCFEDFRIDGIYQNKMWFYSIHGLFEVIFQYHNRKVQRDCLKQLADIWLHHSHAELLSDSMSIKLEEESARCAMSEQGVLFGNAPHQNEKHLLKRPVNEQGEGQNNTYKDKNVSCDYGSEKVLGNCEFVAVQYQEHVQLVETSTQTDEASLNSIHVDISVTETTDTAVQTDIELYSKHDCYLIDIQECHGFSTEGRKYIKDSQENSCQCKNKCPYCVYFSKPDFISNPAFITCLVKLNQLIMFTHTDEHQQFLTTFSEIISIFIDHYPNFIIPKYFLLAFLEEFQREKLFSCTENELEINFLNFACEIIGKELHKFEHQISNNVKNFMQHHIKCIDNLPPAEVIIDEIFPSCMKTLILHWMHPLNNEQSCDSDVPDHVYATECKRLKLSDCINVPDFQVIQLILEFANSALISGVAHVVYSRIRSTNC